MTLLHVKESYQCIGGLPSTACAITVPFSVPSAVSAAATDKYGKEKAEIQTKQSNGRERKKLAKIHTNSKRAIKSNENTKLVSESCFRS